MKKNPGPSVTPAETRTVRLEPFSQEDLNIAEEPSPQTADAGSNRETVQNWEESTTARFLIAQRAFNSGNYAQAANLFKELADTENEALLGLGLSLFALKDFKSAEKDLLDYLVKGNHPLARKTLAFIYYDWDDLQKAEFYAGEGLKQREDTELRRLYEKVKKDLAARGSGLRESTTHFSVIYDGYSQSPLTRKVLGILEEAYSKIGSEIGYFPGEPVTVILYGKKDFYEVTQKPEWAGGLYDGKIRLPLGGADPEEETLREVLFHEYTHALVHSLAGSCPVWINEGLAEYFSRPYDITIGQAIPLRELERSFTQLSADRVQTAYLESYSAVKYLMGQYGAFKMKYFLDGLGAGASLDKAFSDAFYQSYAEFVASWGR